jgi:adenosylcobinamide-GDP ribazoletransferase
MRVADGARSEFRAAAAGLSLLTVLPLARFVVVGPSDVARSAPAFPLVGVAVGSGVAASGVALDGHLPGPVAAALTLMLGVLLTGAIHLDGLADTADALGGRTREHALEIMRDSRVGSYGLAAVALLLIVEATALAQLLEARSTAAITLAYALSRSIAPLVAVAAGPARRGEGLAGPFAQAERRRAVVAIGMSAALVFLIPASHRWAMAASAALCAAAAGCLLRYRFGGATGDTLGATVCACEAACLVLACAR